MARAREKLPRSRGNRAIFDHSPSMNYGNTTVVNEDHSFHLRCARGAEKRVKRARAERCGIGIDSDVNCRFFEFGNVRIMYWVIWKVRADF